MYIEWGNAYQDIPGVKPAQDRINKLAKHWTRYGAQPFPKNGNSDLVNTFMQVRANMLTTLGLTEGFRPNHIRKAWDAYTTGMEELKPDMKVPLSMAKKFTDALSVNTKDLAEYRQRLLNEQMRKTVACIFVWALNEGSVDVKNNLFLHVARLYAVGGFNLAPFNSNNKSRGLAVEFLTEKGSNYHAVVPLSTNMLYMRGLQFHTSTQCHPWKDNVFPAIF